MEIEDYNNPIFIEFYITYFLLSLISGNYIATRHLYYRLPNTLLNHNIIILLFATLKYIWNNNINTAIQTLQNYTYTNAISSQSQYLIGVTIESIRTKELIKLSQVYTNYSIEKLTNSLIITKESLITSECYTLVFIYVILPILYSVYMLIYVCLYSRILVMYIVFAEYGWNYDLNSDLVRLTPIQVTPADATATQELPLSGISHRLCYICYLCVYSLCYTFFILCVQF